MSGLQTLYPNASGAGFGVSTNADNVRANTRWLDEWIMFSGDHPDFDSTLTYTSGKLTEIIYAEQTASAVADGRASGTRIYGKVTLTYTGSALTKVKKEISYNAGSSYAIWVGRAGNAFQNLTYTSDVLTSTTMATS
jgi:hypothetical protein